MSKFKGAKWAQILTLMAAMAASIVTEVSAAKSYADGLFEAVAAGDVTFSSSNFTVSFFNSNSNLLSVVIYYSSVSFDYFHFQVTSLNLCLTLLYKFGQKIFCCKNHKRNKKFFS